MQADFILFMHGHIDRGGGRPRWWPETLLFADRYSRPFEVFARSRSKRYFEKAAVLLGVDSKQAVVDAVDSFVPADLPRWQFDAFSPAYLPGLEQLATTP